MKTKITESEAEELYEDMLNELSPIKIGNLKYETSRVLREIDPIAYRVGFSEYLDVLNEHYDLSDWM